MILRRMWWSAWEGRGRPSRPEATSLESLPKCETPASPDARNDFSRWGVGLLLLLAILSCGRQSTKPGKPVCEVIPDTLDFGHVELGNTAERTFRVTNTGTAGLRASIHLDCGAFRLLDGSADTTIAPGETLAVRVKYSPESRDEARCNVELGDVACGSVALVGNGFRTWHIRADGSGDAPTVQAGIDSSRDGDVVLVGPGTYYENINLRGRAIHLVSEAGPEMTILDGSHGDAPVIVCKSHEDNDTVIEGFTAQGGSGALINDPYSKGGGGVWCHFAAPVIRGCIIRRNEALNLQPFGNARGGGISFGATDPTLPPILLDGNVIEDNYCSRNAGGINIGAPCIIQDNVIRGNATGTGDGGGLYLIGNVGKVIIRRNLILENHAADHGGGLYLANNSGGDPTLIAVNENVILGNTASGSEGPSYGTGGGVWMKGGAILVHNTLAFNLAQTTGSGLAGGGCCLLRTRPGTLIRYNIFYKNLEGGIVTDDLSTAQLVRNLLFANEVVDIEIPGTPPITQEGNLFLDPLFCDTTATSTGALAENSPALTDSLGVIGAVSTPGCGPKTPAVASPWGRAGSRERK